MKNRNTDENLLHQELSLKCYFSSSTEIWL